ncbi:MAG: hypothetical protein ACPGVU_06355 [Limisphaerales bacterium]
MNLVEFLQALGRDGTLVYESSKARVLEPAEEADAVRCLEEMDERRRLEMIGPLPALNREQAVWAARKVYRIGQFLMFRELPAEMIGADLQDDCSGQDDSSRQYSIDLTFCWLPELHRRAESIASGDELTRALKDLSACYPLSSVGVKAGERSKSRLKQLWENAALRALFVDRVIACKAADCVFRDEVKLAVMDALGERSAGWLE